MCARVKRRLAKEGAGWDVWNWLLDSEGKRLELQFISWLMAELQLVAPFRIQETVFCPASLSAWARHLIGLLSILGALKSLRLPCFAVEHFSMLLSAGKPSSRFRLLCLLSTAVFFPFKTV